MPRIVPPSADATPAKSQPILDAVELKFGRVPNLIRTLAHSPAALKFYVAQVEALAGDGLTPSLREQIALVVAGVNQCDYCASAHTLAGKRSGLGSDALSLAVHGISRDPTTQAALAFAKKIVLGNGRIDDEDLKAIRQAGYGEAQIIELISHVSMNIFTNYVNHIAETDNDFPAVTMVREPPGGIPTKFA